MPKSNIEWGESEQPVEGGVVQEPSPEEPRPATRRKRRKAARRRKS